MSSIDYNPPKMLVCEQEKFSTAKPLDNCFIINQVAS